MVDNIRLGKEFEAVVLKLYAQAQDGLAPTSQRLTDELQLEPLSFGRQGTGIAAPIQKLETVEPKETKSQPHIENDSDDEDDTLPAWVKSLKRGNKSARLANLAILQREVIELLDTPLVVDVGAADHDWDQQLFDPLADVGLIKILGFEPDPDSFKKTVEKNRPNREFLPYALGDGKEAQLRVCTGRWMSSLLEPNQTVLKLFGYQSGEVEKLIPLETHRLDDIEASANAAMIKIDTQGTELTILQNASKLMKSVLFVQTEASLLQMYDGQPSLFEMGKWFEDQGFVLHCFAKENKMPYVLNGQATVRSNQILEVDPVFMPNPLKWDRLSTERLKTLAFFAHAMYRSFDVTMLALDVLDRRDGGQRVEAYQLYLDKAALDA
jgi:FkbM family methyltransferase